MQHTYAIVGSIIGIIGTTILSLDLMRSKTGEKSVAEFKQLQDQLELSAQELIVRTNGGLSTLARFLTSYLKLQEIQAQKKEADASGNSLPPSDPVAEELRQLIDGHSEHSLSHLLVSQFAEAQKSLATPDQINEALLRNSDARKRLENRFIEEVKRSQRMKIYASVGVILVGIGAVAQLIDFFV